MPTGRRVLKCSNSGRSAGKLPGPEEPVSKRAWYPSPGRALANVGRERTGLAKGEMVRSRRDVPARIQGVNALRVSFLVLSLLASALLSQGGGVELQVRATPSEWLVNEEGKLEVRIGLRRGRLDPGARIAVAIPGSWVLHAFHPYQREGRTFPYQSYSSLTAELAEFFSVESRPESEWKLEVVEEDADGTYHRFGRTILLTLMHTSLEEGGEIVLRYGSRDKPISASFLAETVPLPVRFDSGDGRWSVVEGHPELRTRPGMAERLLVTVPSQVRADEPLRVHVTARDLFGNPTTLPSPLEVRARHGGRVRLKNDGEADLQETFLRIQRPGFHFVEVRGEGLEPVRSNPVLVTREEPDLKLYWGDLHSHSSLSKDGVGRESFRFARDYSNLDFFASSEHSTGDREDNGVTEEEWRLIQSEVQRFYAPGRFVTILGYECSLPHPYGHHNVYFKEDQAPIYRKHEVKSLQGLWEKLARREAFTVPHHTGIVFGVSSPGASAVWQEDHPLRPLVEIYSGHGQSERYDPEDLLSYDQMVFDQRWKNWFPRSAPYTPEPYREMVSPHSHPGPHYARDAWAAGLILGTIASSDDHTARPGQPSKGLAAVWAPRLEREAVFEALRQRRTYATTGERIYLDFRVNGSLPGSSITAEAPPHITLQVHGTDLLDWVEVVKFDQQDRAYRVLKRWTPGALQLQASLVDERFRGAAFYYVRLRQKELVEGRPVMAWSSPLWVTPAQQN